MKKDKMMAVGYFFMFIFTFCPPLKKDILMKKKKSRLTEEKRNAFVQYCPKQ